MDLSKLNKKKDAIIVFGGAGYVGRYLVHSLCQIYPTHQIFVVTRNISKALFFLNYDQVQITDNLNNIRYDNQLVFNLAFELKTSFRETRKSVEALVKNIMRTVGNHPNETIIHLSSIAVLGNAIDASPSRLRKISSEDIYADAKGYTEELLWKVCEKRGIRLLILRSGNVMGPGSAWADKIILRLREQKPILGIEEEHPSNVTFIGNLVYALSRYATEIENLGTDRTQHVANFAEFGNVSWHQWINIFSDYLNIEPSRWKTDELSDFAPDVLQDLSYIKKEITRKIIKLANQGRATHKLIEKALNYVNASNIRNKAKIIVQSVNRDYIDYSEYRAAKVFLDKTTFGLQGNMEFVRTELPYDFNHAKKSIIGWLKFAGYDKQY